MAAKKKTVKEKKIDFAQVSRTNENRGRRIIRSVAMTSVSNKQELLEKMLGQSTVEITTALKLYAEEKGLVARKSGE
jgi:hypothetical protein